MIFLRGTALLYYNSLHCHNPLSLDIHSLIFDGFRLSDRYVSQYCAKWMCQVFHRKRNDIMRKRNDLLLFFIFTFNCFRTMLRKHFYKDFFNPVGFLSVLLHLLVKFSQKKLSSWSKLLLKLYQLNGNEALRRCGLFYSNSLKDV